MKLQYLGDSKDSFKWDYHDYLTSSLGYKILNVILMLTPDDKTNDGKTRPERFSARLEIINFCNGLNQKPRNIQKIKDLPSATGEQYLVELHKDGTIFTKNNRNEYFSNISNPQKQQVIFIDPDNGFEPEKTNNNKHILYSDVATILEHISQKSVISIFQHFRRISSKKDYARIKERMPSGYTTAICWHSVMFVAVSKSKKTIENVIGLNHKYSKMRGINLLCL